MKKTSFAVGSLMLSTLVLAGCFWTKTDSQDAFTIASCNDYVKLMKCVAEKAGWGEEALAAVDQAIAAWKTLPEDQLTQTCNMAVDAVASNASAYIQLGCEVPASATIQEVIEEPTVETEDATTGEIETTTGEDAAIVESVVNEVASWTSAQ